MAYITRIEDGSFGDHIPVPVPNWLPSAMLAPGLARKRFLKQMEEPALMEEPAFIKQTEEPPALAFITKTEEPA
jgi:hypothetical protein